MMIMCWNVLYVKILFFGVSQDCMLSLFVIVALFWMVFWEHKTELFWCFYVIEVTDVIVDLISEDVWDSEDELTGALID